MCSDYKISNPNSQRTLFDKIEQRKLFLNLINLLKNNEIALNIAEHF